MIKSIIFDYSFLRGKIKEDYRTEKEFVETLKKKGLKISTGAFNSKINGKVSFTQTEIYFICELLKIPFNEMSIYFFKNKIEFNS